MIFKTLRGWLGGELEAGEPRKETLSEPAGPPSQDSSPCRELEPFGKLLLPRARGLEILHATSARRNLHRELRDRLPALSPFQKTELVDRVLARLALLVFDLPASERHHHTGRFGLLDHTLDVAARTARELSGGAFQISPDPAVAHREGPLWAYAGVVLALVHDLGKILDLDVLAPGSAERWDPMSEPLVRFAERHGIRETSPALYHYHPGRGMDGHEQATGTLMPLLLPPGVDAYLGARLGSVLAAFVSTERFSLAQGLSEPAKRVVAVVRRMDPLSTWEGRKAAGPAEGGPVPGPLPGKASLHGTEGVAAASPRAGVPPAPPGSPGLRGGASTPPPVLEATSGELRLGEIKSQEAPAEPGLQEFLEGTRDLRLFKKGPKGDPAEQERRLSAALHPPRFVRLLGQMFAAHRLSRNGLYSESYISPEFSYLVVPDAFRKVAQINKLPWDGTVAERMLGSLRAHPLVVPQDAETLPVFLQTRPDGPCVRAVRLRTPGFIPESLLEQLGVHEYELRALGEEAPALLGSRSSG